MKATSKQVKPFPIVIGPANAEAVTGFPWRWCRDQATALGIPFIGAGKKRGIRAELFIEALERGVVQTTPPASVDQAAPSDSAAHVRAMLGKRLKAGAK
ncbi:MAG: hypothetical protein QM756_26605 [Polyangiaceae bacterium]